MNIFDNMVFWFIIFLLSLFFIIRFYRSVKIYLKSFIAPFIEPCIKCKHLYKSTCSLKKYEKCKSNKWSSFKERIK